jgi:hypothetical protein
VRLQYKQAQARYVMLSAAVAGPATQEGRDMP